MWDRHSIRRALYAVSFVVLFLGLIVYINARSHTAAAPGHVVPGSPDALTQSYGAPITFPAAAGLVAKKFVHDAVLREDLSAAWDESTPTVHGTLSRAAWLTGNIPVLPFPKNAFGGINYRIEHSRARSVLLLISVGSIKANVRFVEYFIEMVPDSGGGWKVNYLGPRGTSPPIPAGRP